MSEEQSTSSGDDEDPSNSFDSSGSTTDEVDCNNSVYARRHAGNEQLTRNIRFCARIGAFFTLKGMFRVTYLLVLRQFNCELTTDAWLSWQLLVPLSVGAACFLFCAKHPRLEFYVIVALLWIGAVLHTFWAFTTGQLPRQPLHCYSLHLEARDIRDLHAFDAFNFSTFMVLLIRFMMPTELLMKVLLFAQVICTAAWCALYMSPLNAGTVMIVALLCLGSVFAVRDKRKVDAEMLAQGSLEVKSKELSTRLYDMLNCMLPPFLVMPMLKDPDQVQAHYVDKASILFILVEDFDHIAREESPEDSLRFLNYHFTQLDEICLERGVTKIETVGAEYVCAVGVEPVPEEGSVGSTGAEPSHGDLLERLVQVAHDVQRLQHSEARGVGFKMGIHTGPVVAGVVGKKLPRLRLFGDTMNTAARMMQKGMPGEVQLGEATLQCLPPTVEVRQRGLVDMKGKGLLMTYLLRHPFETFHEQVRAHSAPMNTINNRGLNRAWSDSTALTPELVRATTLPSDQGILGLAITHASDMSVWSSEGELSMTPTISLNSRRAEPPNPAELRSMPRQTSSASNQHLPFDDALKMLSTDLRSPPTPPRKLSWRSRRQAGAAGTPWRMPGWPCFTYEDENHFQWLFHEECTCRAMSDRLPGQAFFVAVLTFAEAAPFLTRMRAFDGGQFLFEALVALRWFVLLRALALFVLSLAALTAALPEELRQRRWRVGSLLHLAGIHVFLLLMLCSYSVMRWFPPEDDSGGDLQAAELSAEGLARNLHMVMAVPVVVLVQSVYEVRFVHSLMFMITVFSFIFLVYPHINETPFFYGVITRYCLREIIWLILIRSFLAEGSKRRRFKEHSAIILVLQRIDDVLSTLMPPLVVKDLLVVQPHNMSLQHKYDRATVAQSDLCGFTELASTRQPQEVVEIISELFGLFDALTDELEVYKVETVGDAYIAGQAGPPLTRRNSPGSVVLFALGMVRVTHRWSKGRGEAVSVRVGVHTGHCVGGVVGSGMQRYHLFGGLMACLDVLESTAPRGSVHLSGACREALMVEVEQLIAADLEGRAEDEQALPPRLRRAVVRLRLEPRESSMLVTSKGGVHSWDEVGGQTYLASAGYPSAVDVASSDDDQCSGASEGTSEEGLATIV
mmetsp:Transcript_145655/g.378819  ORF Transcript_145655/g.378819 Transcript_145655/m.378819 type:complete len:1133 (+) Transcript_145655:44-3442(+)